MEAPEVVPYEAMLGGPHRPMLDIVQLGVAASPPAAFGGLRIAACGRDGYASRWAPLLAVDLECAAVVLKAPGEPLALSRNCYVVASETRGAW